jgi:NDP-sugar pyrophosphorylase family protein
MKAMILAAGLGTRLRPFTNDRPKALVELNGRTLLEITLARLRSFGVHEVIVNVHHFADQVIGHLRANKNFAMHVEISREEELLDTGGGLKKAAPFFLRDGSDECFVLHNVDVLSSIDLNEMAKRHRERGALATLAVQRRVSSRQLLFDDHEELCGRRNGGDATPEMVRKSEVIEELAFCGVHIISPRIFSQMSETGVFPIIPTYLRLESEGEKICAFRVDDYYWRDLGTPASLHQAAEDLKNGAVR